MKAYVYVSLKKSVLDPQGKTIHSALKKMGYKGLEEVRQGKYFELTLDGGLNRTQNSSSSSNHDFLITISVRPLPPQTSHNLQRRAAHPVRRDSSV